jgi:dipeptidyl aminopeptidase/acylaminoacyl peptidase
LAALVAAEDAQPRRLITVADCVRTRRIADGQVEMSGDGQQVAYIVVAPDIATNNNRYLLYVRDTRADGRRNGRLLLDSEDPVAGLKWPSHSSRLFLLQKADHMQSIMEIEISTGTTTTIFASAEPIVSFSVDAAGDSLVFARTSSGEPGSSPNTDGDYGYPVIFGMGTDAVKGKSISPSSAIYVVTRKEGAAFEVERARGNSADLQEVSALSMSPDGRFVVLNYRSAQVPADWETNPYVRWCRSEGFGPDTLAILDLQTGTLRTIFDSPSAGWRHPVFWAADGRRFALNALAPVDSIWANQDTADNAHADGESWPFTHTHSFAVDIRTGEISEINKNPAIWYSVQALNWTHSDGAILIRENERDYAWIKPESPHGIRIGTSRLPLGAVNIYSAIYIASARVNASSDGVKIVGAFEKSSAAPDLFLHELSTGRTSIVTDLNPEFHGVVLQPPEKVEWRDRRGFRCQGLLIKPFGYEPNRRYPLLIMVKTWWPDYFLSDTQYHTAFPPQPLAAAGFIVLLVQEHPIGEGSIQRSPSYPRRAGEMTQLKGVVESAIRFLDERGMADSSNVGIMGFSTTSWKTDMMLTHFGTRFRAASSADSGLWNYGLYWLSNSAGLMRDSESSMGGPPYGKTFGNWLKFSPAFNASKLRTPLLMEYTARKNGAIDGLELFVALKRQGKPVDLFYYPHGDHVLDRPSERMASLQRNVDWFRFWMRGEEGEAPAYDPDQYLRWRTLRKPASDPWQDGREGAGFP